MKPTRFAFFVACIVAVTAAAADLVVIDLRNRTADDILPALRPMVGSNVSLSGVDYKLLVRGNAAEVAKIREVLAVLDRAPKQLLISVRYTGAPQRMVNDAGVSANGTDRGTQITIQGGSTVRSGTESNVSSIRVLEGNSAHVASGQSVPIVTAFAHTQSNRRSIGNRNTGSGIGIITDYRELSSGFNVLPRVNDDRVVLEISAQYQQRTNSNGGADTQHTTTTVAGRLGDWIDLGGVTSSATDQQSGFNLSGGGRRIATQSDQRSIAIKVEQVQ